MRKLKLQVQMSVDGYIAGPNGEMDFIPGSSACTGRLVAVSEASIAQSAAISVATRTLDSIVEELMLDRLNLVKIDVEGADFEALEGFKITLKKFRPDILIEITDNSSSLKISELLKEINLEYIYYEIDDIHGLVKKEDISKAGNRNFLICKKESLPKIKSLLI